MLSGHHDDTSHLHLSWRLSRFSPISWQSSWHMSIRSDTCRDRCPMIMLFSFLFCSASAILVSLQNSNSWRVHVHSLAGSGRLFARPNLHNGWLLDDVLTTQSFNVGENSVWIPLSIEVDSYDYNSRPFQTPNNKQKRAKQRVLSLQTILMSETLMT